MAANCGGRWHVEGAPRDAPAPEGEAVEFSRAAMEFGAPEKHE